MAINHHRVINATTFTVALTYRDKGFSEEKGTTLIPGQAASISDTASSQLIARDTHSGLPLAVKPKPQSEGEWMITTEGVRSQGSGSPKSIRVKNTSQLAIEICQLNDFGTEIQAQGTSLVKLLPGREEVLKLADQTILGGRLYASGKYFQFFITNDSENQLFELNPVSRSSDVSSSLTVENRSTFSLRLQWIDFDGKLRHTKPLEPGEKLTERTYLSHPWILRDAVSGLPLDICVGSYKSHNWVFTGEHLRSIAGTKAGTVSFWNAAPFPVHLYWKDYEGQADQISTLAPGREHVQPTEAGHVWEARDARNGRILQQFLPAPKKQQIARIVPRNDQGQLPSEIAFVNDSGLTVELIAQDLEGKARVFATLPHRAVHRQPTNTADHWEVKSKYTQQTLEKVVVTQEHFTHRITAQTIRSREMKKAVEATFVNTTPFTVDVSWIDYDGEETFFHRLKPKEKIVQPTHATHAWRFRERETGDILHLYVAGPKPRQRVEVVMKPIHSLDPAAILFHNQTGLTTEVVWFDAKGQPKVLRTLIPGRKAAFSTFATHAWVLRDKHSQTVLKTTVAQPGKQSVALKNTDIRSKRSDRGTQLIFRNFMPFKVDIHWIDYEGKETPHETIRPGGRIVKSSYTTQPYRFRHHVTKQEVGVFLPKEVSRQAADIAFRAYERRTPTKMEVRNMTALQVQVYEVDANGKDVPLFLLPPREGRTVNTHSTYPIMVRDVLSNEAVAFTIADEKPQRLEVTGEHLRSNRTEFPVWINWKNTLKLPVDLFWVKYDGSEELKRTLAPGESFEISSYPSHVWRARYQKAGTEADLYITGKNDKQTRAIGTVPPLRTTAREGGVLWDGEVALYEKPDFGGRVWIAHGDLPDFGLLSGFNDSIDSLKVGPNTAVTVFEDYYFNALPQDMNPMAREVKQAVEDGFQSPLNDFKQKIDNNLNQLKQGKQQAFIDQVNLIQGIFTKAVEQTPGQIGVLIERYIKDQPAGPGEQLVNINLDAGKSTLERVLRDLLRNRSSAEDRAAFAEAILRVLQSAQAAIFNALTAEWEATLEKEIRDVAGAPLELLGKYLDASAVASAERAVPLIQKADSDVFHVEVSDLATTDIGRNAMSSLRILKNLSPDKLRITSTNKVVREPYLENETFKEKAVYRTTIKFPTEVTEVQIWGTENQTIQISDQSYKVGPKDDQSIRVQPRVGGALVLTVHPDKIGVPPLLIRTNTMPPNGRVFIFPDADVHRKFAQMEKEAFVKGIPDKKATATGGVRKLDAKAGVSDEELLATQEAIQTLSKTSTASVRNNATGTAADRRLVTGMMDMSAFQLDFGENSGAADAAFRPIDPATVYAQAENAEELGQGFFDFFEDIGEGIASVAVAVVDVVEEGVDFLEQAAKDTAEFFEDTANAIAEGFEEFGELLEEGFAAIGDAFEAAGEWIEQGVKDGLEFMENTIEAAGEFLVDVGTAVMDAAKVVADGVTKGLQLVVQTVEGAVTFIVDTVEKVGEVVMYIAKKVVEVVEKVVDFICALFDWADIISTHDVLVGLIDNSFSMMDGEIGKMQQKTGALIQQARSEIGQMMSDTRSFLGIPDIKEEEEEDNTDALDVLMWLFEKISGVGGGAADLVKKGKEQLMEKAGVSTASFGLTVQIPRALQEELKGVSNLFTDLLADIAEEGLEAATGTIRNIGTRLKQIIKNPGQAPQLLLGLFLEIGETFIDTGLEIAGLIANAFFSLVRSLLKVVKLLLDYTINIPFVSDFYEFISGSPLTLKSLGSLLIAIPVTIIGKLVFGTDNFHHRVLSQDLSVANNRLAWYGGCHIILGLTEGVRDIIGLGRDDEPDYDSFQFNLERGFSLLSGSFFALISYIPSIAAIVLSGPYTQVTGLSFGAWFMQIIELVLDVAGEIGEWFIYGLEKVGKGFRIILGSLTIAAGVIHLILNALLLSVENEYENEGEPGKHLLATAYVTTTLPVILGGVLSFPKIPFPVAAVIVGGKVLLQFTEGGVCIALANERN